MTDKALEAKKAYIAESRLSNYPASLRLEGVDISPADIDLKYKTREEVLAAFEIRQCNSSPKPDTP